MSKPAKKKVLLMGKSGSGKTSMRSIIFANYVARDTRRLGATIDVEHSHVRFLGNLVLNLWDCGGQESFMDNYLTTQRDSVFSNVEVLIYVFDVESREIEKDLGYYKDTLEAIETYSPEATVFVLVHKMDLVPEEQREALFQARSNDLAHRSQPHSIVTFPTSIWNETLYKAWSAIVYTLVPNVSVLERELNAFAGACEAEEVVLFEKTTFLVIAHSRESTGQDSWSGGTPNAAVSNGPVDGRIVPQLDVHRFEKISNIIKQFKLSCSKSQAQFQSMEIRNSLFAAFIDSLTSNTYVMVVMADPTIQSAATMINIKVARKHFETLEVNLGS
ncbi:hypothetical protein M427DRAFT_52849 [Gonapodya prolifera JEL478]|uniref:GTP-binding protein n=1 Tax=Gonapodya prolifera (strain JEL478) TaxID=1344416 RepID=A0A139ARN9_GONPJ|nr:hypothetical protein M427DRAFT_52849 [Gonapodya prolifera JEL478]|eukprot:KXS19408.1 hypothetical protein M427DRAFT_52849 [Gonapodya prolifera JEL478]